MRKHSYSEDIYGGLRLESVTPTALFPTNHTLTQGSLHYRLATLGYQKRNPYGVRQFCKHPLHPLFLLTRDENKKAQHLWRCDLLNVLTQGSSHYRLATLGYQKQNPDGVRLPHKHPLRPLFLLKWLSKTEGDGVHQSANILCAALPFEMAIKSGSPDGFCLPHKFCKHPLLASPFSLERGWG